MRFIIGAIGLICCVWGFSVASRTGQARLLVNHRKDAALFNATNEAVRLSPNDPEVHYARAMVMWRMQRLPEAIKEYESVVTLRPRDYVPWLDLGSARDRNGDEIGALAAFETSVRLAPHYALPRWELGNLLLRMGRQDDGFAELRQASRSNPKFLPELIELAWDGYSGEAEEVLRVVQPHSDAARLTLAHFFATQGAMHQTLDLIKSAGSAAATDRFLMTVRLMEARRYRDAASVWRLGGESVEDAVISDGGFEAGTFSIGGFGWRIKHQTRGSQVVLDRTISESGTNSLRLDFEGDTETDAQFARQLVLLEDSTRYRLNFMVRTEDLTSGGLPFVAIADAGPDGRLLGRSSVVPSGTLDWQVYSVDFETSKGTEAAFFTIQRQRCQEATCPIFGRVWFDNFSLTKLGRVRTDKGRPDVT